MSRNNASLTTFNITCDLFFKSRHLNIFTLKFREVRITLYNEEYNRERSNDNGHRKKKQNKTKQKHSPLDGVQAYRKVTHNVKFAGTDLYASVERDTVRIKCISKKAIPCPRQRLEPGPLDPGASTPTM